MTKDFYKLQVLSSWVMNHDMTQKTSACFGLKSHPSMKLRFGEFVNKNTCKALARLPVCQVLANPPY